MSRRSIRRERSDSLTFQNTRRNTIHALISSYQAQRPRSIHQNSKNTCLYTPTTDTLIPSPPSIHQLLLTTLDIRPLPRKTTPPVLYTNNFVRAFLLHRNTQMVPFAPLSLDFQELALAPTCRICAARIREFKGRRAGEIEFEICATTLVNVDFADLTT